MSKCYRAVLFDLDGTLLYTLPDIRDSLNRALSRFGLPARSTEEVRCFVGNGAKNLVARAIPGGLESPVFQAVYEEYSRDYARHCRDQSLPYDGIPELLRALRKGGILCAVVTNKGHGDACALVKELFGDDIQAVEGKKPGRPVKPDPAAPRAALSALGVTAEDALYVGDSEVDLDTAAQAGLDCVLVSWGYRDRSELKKRGAAGLIDAPAELLQYWK